MKRYAIVSKKDDVSRHLAVLIKDELKELIYDEEPVSYTHLTLPTTLYV